MQFIINNHAEAKADQRSPSAQPAFSKDSFCWKQLRLEASDDELAESYYVYLHVYWCIILDDLI